MAKPKLLIVDDDPHLRKLLTIYLRDKWDVSVAAEGEEAIEVWRKEKPKVVLLDLILPYYGGFRLCQDFKGDGSFRSHVIMMTGEEGDDTRDIASECGADDFVLKPFDPAEMVRKLDALST